MVSLSFVYSSDFGERIIRNMINDPSYCNACGILCEFCKYSVYTYVQNIHAAIELPEPTKLPRFIENPKKYIPKKLPSVDLCIATGLHQDLLLALPSCLWNNGVKGLIVPIEDFREVPAGLQKQLEQECAELSIELALPKPFCSLDSSESSPLISKFVREFNVGKPSLKITTEKKNDSKIIRGIVIQRSAPCGSTWYVARKLIGCEVHRDKIRDVIAKAHHSFPCTATMTTDPELGEPILHMAGYSIREAVESQLY